MTRIRGEFLLFSFLSWHQQSRNANFPIRGCSNACTALVSCGPIAGRCHRFMSFERQHRRQTDICYLKNVQFYNIS